jgi:hypothetical protein
MNGLPALEPGRRRRPGLFQTWATALAVAAVGTLAFTLAAVGIYASLRLVFP